MSRQWDALVIGAGPAGLRAASVIAESGLEVVLVDEPSLPRRPKSTAMSRLRARRKRCRGRRLPRRRGACPALPAFRRGIPAGNDESRFWNRIASWPPVVRKSSICGQKRHHRRGRDGAPVPFRGWTPSRGYERRGGRHPPQAAGLLPGNAGGARGQRPPALPCGETI